MMRAIAIFTLLSFLSLISLVSYADKKGSLGRPPGLTFNDGEGMQSIGAPHRISRPNAIALSALAPSDNLEISVNDWIIFRPRGEQKNHGVILYHGAETDPRGYARPLRALAEEGYFVVAVTMPKYMAVTKPFLAKDVIEKYPEINMWTIIGHSLGGTMAARFAQKHEDLVSGLLFWDSYPLPNAKLNNKSLIIGQIYRTDLEGNKPANFKKVEHLLPKTSHLFPIKGAEHTYFGDFNLAAHRPEPLKHLRVEEQQKQVISATLSFLKEVETAHNGAKH